MSRLAKRIATMGGGAMLLLTLAAAQGPTVLAQASGGLWELSGGSGPVRRLCLADPSRLAQIEHRAANCTRSVVRDRSVSAEIHYTCPDGGFGHSTITQLTPRSLRIETQGISGNAPFYYVVQARRVGNCPAH